MHQEREYDFITLTYIIVMKRIVKLVGGQTGLLNLDSRNFSLRNFFI